MRPCACLVLLLASFAAAQHGGTPSQDLKSRFLQPPDDARIMMRWWWFGPAVTKLQVEREMQVMKAGGIGGFEVQPVYPLQLDNPAAGFRNLPFLSKEFLDVLSFTSGKARELGLRMDLTLGSGWPFGGPQIPLSQAAGRLRVERVKVAPSAESVPVPTLREGESVIAAFAAGSRRELPVSAGSISLRGEQTPEVLVFLASHTRQQVKRASVNGEGYVLDHYSRTATDHYLKSVGEPLLAPLAGQLPAAIFCDSLEVFGSDWTPDLLSEFQKRRGYDLRPYLPALVEDIGPKTAGIRYDWGRTLTELLEDRFMAPVHQWARAHGTKFRIQGYGIPPAVVSSNAHTDIAEGEGAQWKVVRASRWASSANHIYGRPVTTSETWTWLHSPVFRATPLDIKAEADIHFIQGINQLIGHGWPYTAEGVEYPGWRFYAAGVFNDKNPWWIAMPELARYLQRVSFLMREGRPGNDFALYLPNSDAWSQFRPGHVHMIEQQRELLGPDIIPQIVDYGYGFDFIDDRSLETQGRIEKGTLAMGDGRYRVVVLPAVEYIPVETMRKLETFARSGGIILATRRMPSSAPGLQAKGSEHAEIRAIAQRLFSSSAKLVPTDAELGAALRRALTPDMQLGSVIPEIGFIRRTTPSAEIYFIANTGNVPHKTTATFRVAGKEPEWWDALTGRITPAQVTDRTASTTTVALEIEPHGSRVLAFTNGPRRNPPALVAGSTVDLSSGWTIRFGENGPASKLDKLSSWTDDERTRFYSGTATYERSVSVPEGMLRKGAELWLDFGEGAPVAKPAVEGRRAGPGMRAWYEGPVREAAVVYVNGKRAGSVWCPPYRLDVTPYLKTGANELRVVVGNLALNYMAGHPLPDYKALNAKYGVRFEPQDMDKVQPIPSGLFGPIRLVSYTPGS